MTDWNWKNTNQLKLEIFWCFYKVLLCLIIILMIWLKRWTTQSRRPYSWDQWNWHNENVTTWSYGDALPVWKECCFSRWIQRVRDRSASRNTFTSFLYILINFVGFRRHVTRIFLTYISCHIILVVFQFLMLIGRSSFGCCNWFLENLICLLELGC